VKIAAVIPTRYHLPQLSILRLICAQEDVDLYVLESALFEHRIYRMWNAGVALARAAGAEAIAIVNDDVNLLPGSFAALAKCLEDGAPDVAVVYPNDHRELAEGLDADGRVQPTTGTWGAGGMTGFCFMFRADAELPTFDENYGWWYGDDVFEEGCRARGYTVGRALGVPIYHEAGTSAGRHWTELSAVVMSDRLRYEARGGHA
jgi:GT2 family glycosyltransferase